MKLDKIMDKLGKEVLEEMDKMGEEDLHKVIMNAHGAIDEATEQRNDNPRYRAAKEVVADLNAGVKNVRNFQSAKIGYALMRLKELGQG